MNTRLALLTFATALFLHACSIAGEKTSPDADATDSTAATMETVPSDPMNTMPVPVSAPTAAVSDPNPAHGEPGHRCEIPVGASLSTAPPPGSGAVAPQTSPMMISPPGMPQATPQATPPSAGGGRINPAHGEPGHDCAVAVGAPLP